MTRKILLIGFTAATLFSPLNASAALVINEFLADPPSDLAGDTNQDGSRNSSEDEFIELLNLGPTPIHLSSMSIWDSTELRHEFLPGTLLLPFERATVFGGGRPSGIPNWVTTASSGSLSLNNSGDEIFLKNALGETVDHLLYSKEANDNQSLTRFPEGTGPFKPHSTVSSQHLLFSPGADREGQAFVSQPIIKGEAPIPLQQTPTTVPELGTAVFLVIGLLILKWFNKGV